MSVLRKKLIQKLEKVSDVEVRLWKPNSDFMVINYKGKEVAHFHGNNELDIRLSKEVIKREGLVRPADSTAHPKRSKGSRWMMASFKRSEHLDEIVRLVELAIELR